MQNSFSYLTAIFSVVDTCTVYVVKIIIKKIDVF